MSIGERIRLLRRELKLTQQEFSDQLGTKRTTLASYESGKNTPSDAVISLISLRYNINEDWLRTGQGEMKPCISREAEIAQITATLFKSEEDSFRYRMIKALCAMDENGWYFIEKLAEDIVNGKPVAPSDIDIKEELYEKERI